MRVMVLATLGTLMALSGGCNPISMAARTGAKIVKGVDADVLPIRDVTAGTLSGYNTLKLGKVSTDIGGLCPPEVISQIQRTAPEIFVEEAGKRFRGGPNVLQADICVRFFKKKGQIGGEGRLDLLVTLVDGNNGTEVGKLYVEGITESPLQTGSLDMVKKTTKKLAAYLDKRKKE